MTNSALRISAAVALVAAACTAAVAADAGRARELTTLVGQDVGLCVELRGLTEQSQRFLKSDLYQRLQKLPAVREFLQSKDFAGVQAMRKHVEKLAGRPLDGLVRDMFGRSVVLAVYPRRDGQPEGVLLTKTAGQQSLADAIRLLERAEPGQVTQSARYLDVEYHRRTRPSKKSGGDKTLFYARLNDVLVLSDRESMIQKVIRLSQRNAKSPADDKPLSASADYQSARKTLRGDPVMTAFLNPRPWDATLKIGAGDAQSPLPATLWKSCRWAMASVRLDGGVVVDAVLDYDRSELPSLLREALERLSGDLELLDRVPKSALMAFAGRLDPSMLTTLVTRLQEGEGGKDLRSARATAKALLRFDPVTDLLPRLKRGAVLYVVARKVGPAGGIPFDALFAVGLAAQTPGQPNWRDPLEGGLENVLRFVTNVSNLKAAQGAGDRPPQFAAVKAKTEAGLRLHWIDSLAGFQPAFGLTPAFLVVASSPELIRQFEASEKSERLVNDSTFQAWRRAFFADANQILFVNAALLRTHLKSQRENVLALQVKHGGKAKDEAARELDAAVQFLGVIDGAFIAARIGRSRLRLTIGGVTKPAGGTPKAGGQ